jgi:two-component system cell cycle sensor histidine kinase/response regulator CckA
MGTWPANATETSDAPDACAAIDVRAFAEVQFRHLALAVDPLCALEAALQALATRFHFTGIAVLPLARGGHPVARRVAATGRCPAEGLTVEATVRLLERLGTPLTGTADDLGAAAAGLDRVLARLDVLVPEGGGDARAALWVSPLPDASFDAVFDALRPVLAATVARLERQRSDSEHRFAVALRHAADAIEICNRDAVIEWVNPAFEQMTGYSRDEAVGRTPAALFRGGQHGPEFYDAIDREIRAGRTWRGQMLSRRKNGELYPQACVFTPVMRADGTIDCVVAVRADITEHVRAEVETQRRRSNAVFRSLVELLPDGLAVQQGHRIRLANPALGALLGLDDPAGLLDRSLAEFAPPAAASALTAWLTAAEAGEGDPAPRTFALCGADRRELTVELTALPWPSYEGGAALVVVARDVTERHRLQGRVVMTDRLTTMGMLLAAVGHEINNPLAYVLSSLEVLRQEVPPLLARHDPVVRREITDCLDDAWEGIHRITATVADFRAFSRTRSTRGPVDLQRLVELTARMAQNEIRPRARLVLEVTPIAPFEGHENRIAQVLLNLLLNAAQAIPDGHADENEIRLTVRPAGDRVTITVHDTGGGIPPELQDRIFEPFFTTKSASGGSGLGLSICRAITAEMGGTLRVESQNGRGTTFTLELPTPRGLPDEGRRSPVPAAVAALLRVLVIDDEPLVGRAVERILAPGTVEVAVGGRAGLDRVLHDGPWDAILCDLVMPDLSGTDVFEAATRVRPALARRFVFMSGGAFTPRLRAFIDENPERCLGKPFDNGALRAAIDRAARA